MNSILWGIYLVGVLAGVIFWLAAIYGSVEAYRDALGDEVKTEARTLLAVIFLLPLAIPFWPVLLVGACAFGLSRLVRAAI